MTFHYYHSAKYLYVRYRLDRSHSFLLKLSFMLQACFIIHQGLIKIPQLTTIQIVKETSTSL